MQAFKSTAIAKKEKRIEKKKYEIINDLKF